MFPEPSALSVRRSRHGLSRPARYSYSRVAPLRIPPLPSSHPCVSRSETTDCPCRIARLRAGTEEWPGNTFTRVATGEATSRTTISHTLIESRHVTSRSCRPDVEVQDPFVRSGWNFPHPEDERPRRVSMLKRHARVSHAEIGWMAAADLNEHAPQVSPPTLRCNRHHGQCASA